MNDVITDYLIVFSLCSIALFGLSLWGKGRES